MGVAPAASHRSCFWRTKACVAYREVSPRPTDKEKVGRRRKRRRVAMLDQVGSCRARIGTPGGKDGYVLKGAFKHAKPVIILWFLHLCDVDC